MKSGSLLRLGSIVSLCMAFVLGIPATADSQQICHWILVATVESCDGWGNCTITRIFDLECTPGPTPPGGGGPGPDPWPPSGNPNDLDSNGILDDFENVVGTSDPCAFNFDANDRLGSNHGGPNTIRPNHSGVDIQGNEGDIVRSLIHGQVVTVHGPLPPNNRMGACGHGLDVRMGFGATATIVTYCHLMEPPFFAVGEWVDVGWPVGYVGETGSASGPHLHVRWQAPDTGLREFFSLTGNQPEQSQLDPGGC